MALIRWEVIVLVLKNVAQKKDKSKLVAYNVLSLCEIKVILIAYETIKIQRSVCFKNKQNEKANIAEKRINETI